MTISEFRKKFTTNEDCLKYLVELKWGDGYCCHKCKCSEYLKGRKWFYRRCKSCKYDESVTANTMFHKCKLPLLTVMEMAYRISVKKIGMSSVELSKEFGCQQKSAWLLKGKFQNAMESSGQYPLEDAVEVDEFLVGGIEENMRGRSHGKKSLVVIGVEKVLNKKGKPTMGRAYARVINTASTVDLQPFFEEKISADAEITTDGWPGYLPLRKQFTIKKKLSDGGKGFPLLHTHIMNIKGWLRGVHHKCSNGRLQNYLNEFHFRFNRRSFLDTILTKLMERAIAMNPIPYKIIRCELST